MCGIRSSLKWVLEMDCKQRKAASLQWAQQYREHELQVGSPSNKGKFGWVRCDRCLESPHLTLLHPCVGGSLNRACFESGEEPHGLHPFNRLHLMVLPPPLPTVGTLDKLLSVQILDCNAVRNFKVARINVETRVRF